MGWTDLDSDKQREQERSEHLREVLPCPHAEVEQDLVRDLDDDPPDDEKHDRGLVPKNRRSALSRGKAGWRRGRLTRTHFGR